MNHLFISFRQFVSRRKMVLPVALVLIFTGAVETAPNPGKSNSGLTGDKNHYVENEILIEYKSGTSAASRYSRANALNARVSSDIGKSSGITRLKLEDGYDVKEALTMARSMPEVEYAQPNYIYHATKAPDDPDYGQLWGMKNTGQTVTGGIYSTNNPGTDGMDLNLEDAWDLITDCSSVTVAVIDTGVKFSHEDLVDNMWSGSSCVDENGADLGGCDGGYDYVNDDTDPVDDNGHGSHVAGIIGAVGNNAKGVTGVCWKAKIMAIKALDSDGSGTTADIVSGIYFALENGAKVINTSLGGESSEDQAYSDAMDAARDGDVVVVAGADNGGSDGVGDNVDGNGDDDDASTSVFPCAFTQDNLVCVAALDQSYALSSFSNYGASSVDVGAPGTNIKSPAKDDFKDMDDFSDCCSDWLFSGDGDWTSTTLFGLNAMTDPSGWGTDYENNKDYIVYKIYDFSNSTSVEMNVKITYSIEVHSSCTYDNFGFVYDTTGAMPENYIGDYTCALPVSDWESRSMTLPSAPGNSNYALGFRLKTNANTTDEGAAIAAFSVISHEPNAYDEFNGTSRASAYVAGIAAMVRAFNPDFTYGETVNAILGGGDETSSLEEKTTTGMAADAYGSLIYINAPTGLSSLVE